MRLFSKQLNQNKFTRFLKKNRNQLINWFFLRRKSRNLGILISNLANDLDIIFTIAFNKPDCVRIMIKCWETNVRNTVLVVVDNSSSVKNKREIENLCIKKDIPYLALPKNPEWHPNRSHALAMNWTFYNIVKKCNPKSFGFIDHDCFPFKPFSLPKEIKGFAIYGDKRVSEKYSNIWNLWAGFCFFNYEIVKEKNMNFTHSIELGLDTGGENWNILYKNLNSLGIRFSNTKDSKFKFAKNDYRTFQVLDCFLHVGSASREDKGNNMNMGDWMKMMKHMNELQDSNL